VRLHRDSGSPLTGARFLVITTAEMGTTASCIRVSLLDPGMGTNRLSYALIFFIRKRLAFLD
jgi:hypothetical protein